MSQLQKIEALDHCQNLVRLHLYSNLITRIEGVESLFKLEKLWLNGNAISTIDVSELNWKNVPFIIQLFLP